MVKRRALILTSSALCALLAAVAVNPPAAEAGETPPPALQGSVHFAPPTAVRTCVNSVPTSVALTLNYDATALTAAIPDLKVFAFFVRSNGTSRTRSAAAKVRLGHQGTLTRTLAVPASEVGDSTVELVLDSDGWEFGAQSFGLQCDDPAPLQVDGVPSVTPSTSCRQVLYVTTDTSSTSLAWDLQFVSSAGFGPGQPIPPGVKKTRYQAETASQLPFGFHLFYSADPSDYVEADGGVYTQFPAPSC